MAGGVSHILTAVITWDQKKTKKLIYSKSGLWRRKKIHPIVYLMSITNNKSFLKQSTFDTNMCHPFYMQLKYMIDHWTVCSARSWPDCQSTSCKRRSRCPGSHLFGVRCAEISGLAYIYISDLVIYHIIVKRIQICLQEKPHLA